MRKPTLALSLIFLLTVQTAPVMAAGDDWVEDDHVSGFYKKGIMRTPDDYETPPQDMQSDEMGSAQGASQFQMPDEFGSQQFSNRMPQQNRMPQNQPQQPQPKGFMGKAKSLGKSIINTPKNILNGTDDLLDDPGFWQNAGAVAGMGASAYMNMRRGPYYGGYNPYGYGYGSPYGSVNPLGGFGYNPYGGLGGLGYGGVLGNPYGGFYGNPYAGTYGNPLGMIAPGSAPYGSPANPYSPFNVNPYTGYSGLGGINSVNPYGMMTPYGYGGLGGFGGYNGLGGLGGYRGLGGLGGFGGPSRGFGTTSPPSK